MTGKGRLMVKEVYGDLLRQQVDIIVHKTSCNGTMNDGLALQIKTQLLTSQEYDRYVSACKERGADLLGKTFLLNAPDGRIIANCFAQDPPKEKGKQRDAYYNDLMYAAARVRNHARISGEVVGVPGLFGCGSSGGNWPTVRDMLYKLFNGENEPLLIICYNNESEFRKWNPGR